MKLSYRQLKEKRLVFKQLSGMRVTEFEEVCRRVRPLWEAEEAKKCPQGRRSHFQTLEDRLLALFMYYRTYVTHEWIGYLFGMHNANVCRQFQRLEPLVARVIHIKKDRTLTKEKVEAILVDATEQPIQRPRKRHAQKS